MTATEQNLANRIPHARHRAPVGKRTLALITSGSLVASGLAYVSAVLPSAANGADAVGCEDGDVSTSAQPVGGGVCEIRFTADDVWTTPAGVTSLEALLVGAGGAAWRYEYSAYGGGGGEVVLASLGATPGVPISITVGRGATSSSTTRGGDSAVSQTVSRSVARGGSSAVPGDAGGRSGSNFGGELGGGGAGSVASWSNGGAGLTVSAMQGAGMFLSLGECFGGGGASSSLNINSSGVDGDDPAIGQYVFDSGNESAAGCGAGSVYFHISEQVARVGGYLDSRVVQPAANRGGGGGVGSINNTPIGASGTSPWNVLGVPQSGADGMVILRFSFAQAPPPTPGSSSASVSPVVTNYSKRNVVPGDVIRVTGQRLDTVQSAKVNGKAAPLTAITSGAFTLKVPAGLPAGSYDLELFGSFGTLIERSPFTVAKKQIKRLVPGFAGDSPVMTTQVVSTIRSTLNRLPGAMTLVCTGSTSNTRVTPFDKRLATQRATRACARAKALKPELTTRIQIAPASGVGPVARNIRMVLRNY